MKVNRIALPLIAAALLGAPAALRAQYGPPPPPGGYYQQGPGGWDAPPDAYTRDLQRQGFHDGLYGAQKDFENHRQPNVRNRDEFRNYRGPDRRAYRDAFAQGYSTWWNHPRGNNYRDNDRRDNDRDRHDDDHRDNDRHDDDRRPN